MSNGTWVLAAAGAVIITAFVVIGNWPRRRDLGSV